MSFDTKLNSGAVFVNNRKKQDSHPDRTGKANIGGAMYYVDGWLRQTKGGEPYLSLSFKPMDAKPATQKPQTGGTIADMESDIPF